MRAFATQPAAPQIQVQIPAKLLPIFEPRRFKIMHGGRGGAKSHTVAQALILLAMRARHRILCVREVQKSLRESSKKVIEFYIDKLGLGAYFQILEAEIRCRTTGTSFTFSGLKDHNADSIKSFEGATLVWVEEAHSVTARSWNILIPTIIRTDGAEIWATFNPDQETDYVYQRFVKNTDQNAWVVQVNWRDNPWFNEAMDEERRTLKAANDDLYQHIWEGKTRSLAGLLFKRHWFKRYDLGQQPTNLRNYLASDYAGEPDYDNPENEPDWTEHAVVGVDEHEHFWVHDWWSGQEAPDVYIAAWIALIKVHKPQMAFEEKGVILRTINGTLNKAMLKDKAFVHREGLASTGSKFERALAFAAVAATGIVHIPNTEWGDRLINQLCAFTGQDGKVDDMVDACSKFFQGIEDVVRAAKPPEADKPKPKFGTGNWHDRYDAEDAAEAERKQRYYR